MRPPGRGWLAFAFAVLLSLPTLALAASPAPLVRSPDGRRLALTFEETFRAPPVAPGRRTWRTTFGGGGDLGIDKRTLAGNGEEEVYVDPAFGARIGSPGLDPFRIGAGGLTITAQPAPPRVAGALQGRRYISGLISSQPSFAQRYGYFEARARLPAGKGLWPALWLLPANLSWPPEIDIMESIGDPGTVYVSLHSHAGDFTQPVSVTGDGFHTFAVSWDPRQVAWFVDGRQVARRPTPSDMNQPMFLLANLAVGGHWPGAPDAATRFPARFAIQFIRAYRFD
ncbi:MAG TPA: glycoside hydrolase family 16 protein [Caulobacteraceae bacterium]|nr:glycoside hydrolase family 16 protein [Caulobacteraceae bacterium]